MSIVNHQYSFSIGVKSNQILSPDALKILTPENVYHSTDNSVGHKNAVNIFNEKFLIDSN
jgi:hypothetical protein